MQNKVDIHVEHLKLDGKHIKFVKFGVSMWKLFNFEVLVFFCNYLKDAGASLRKPGTYVWTNLLQGCVRKGVLRSGSAPRVQQHIATDVRARGTPASTGAWVRIHAAHAVYDQWAWIDRKSVV